MTIFLPAPWRLPVATFLAVALLVAPSMSTAQTYADRMANAVQDMELAAGGAVKVTQSPITGLATFVAPEPNRRIPLVGAASASPEEKARTFVSSYGQAFGL